MKNSITILGIISLLSISYNHSYSQVIYAKLLGDFQDGWTNNWIERELYRLPTEYKIDTDLSEKPKPYQVVQDKDNLVLKLESKQSTTTLWRGLKFYPIKYGKIRWRWKVDRSLSSNKKEKLKVGDDYAARIIIVFEPHLVSWKTRAISYVWAGKAPVGSIYKSPYSNSVATVVVESGNKQAGDWVSEERNFVRDYRNFFGKTPEMVSGVAIMVDTDNTKSQATAWFDDIVLDILNATKDLNKISFKGAKIIFKE